MTYFTKDQEAQIATLPLGPMQDDSRYTGWVHGWASGRTQSGTEIHKVSVSFKDGVLVDARAMCSHGMRITGIFDIGATFDDIKDGRVKVTCESCGPAPAPVHQHIFTVKNHTFSHCQAKTGYWPCQEANPTWSETLRNASVVVDL